MLDVHCDTLYAFSFDILVHYAKRDHILARKRERDIAHYAQRVHDGLYANKAAHV